MQSSSTFFYTYMFVLLRSYQKAIAIALNTILTFLARAILTINNTQNTTTKKTNIDDSLMLFMLQIITFRGCCCCVYHIFHLKLPRK